MSLLIILIYNYISMRFSTTYPWLLLFILVIAFFINSVNLVNAQSFSIEEFLIPTENSYTEKVEYGIDKSIWFTEENANKIGKISANGEFTEYIIDRSSKPHDIIAGPDGNMWFTEIVGNSIGRISENGAITRYPLPNSNSHPFNLTVGSDKNIWFTEYWGNKIGKISPSGIIVEYPIPTFDSRPYDISLGADGNVWFTEENGKKIGKITPEGIISEYSIPSTFITGKAITLGSDGNMWFIEATLGGLGPKIAKITPGGIITEYDNLKFQPMDIVVGKDKNLWFTGGFVNKIGSITPNGQLSEFNVPEIDNRGITIDESGNIWFVETSANKLAKVTVDDIVPTITPSPPANGSGLKVPLFKQGVFPYTDASPAWEGEEFDHAGAGQFACGRTMAQCGCATSSIAMVFNYHGITKLPDGTNLNPGTLNTWMKNNNGYHRNLGVIWPVASALSKKAKTQNPDFSYDALEYDTRTNFSSAALSNDLEQGIPNILQVNAPGMHFIVAKGKTSNSFEINDPLFNRTTLAAYSNSAVGVRRYVPSNTDLSYITYIVDEDVEISIKDEFGNGYGDSYLEYSPAQLSEEPNVPDSSAVRVLYFAKPESGSYTVELNGPEGKKFRLDEYIITEEGDVKDDTYAGTLRSDQPTVFHLSYDKTSLDNTKTIPEITFAMLKADIQRLYLEGKIKSKFIYTVLKLQAEIAERASLLERQPVGYKLSIVTLKALQVELTRYRGKLISEEAYQILYTDCETIIKQLQKQIAGETDPGGGSES